jgi:hypothetical protein
MTDLPIDIPPIDLKELRGIVDAYPPGSLMVYRVEEMRCLIDTAEAAIAMFQDEADHGISNSKRLLQTLTSYTP